MEGCCLQAFFHMEPRTTTRDGPTCNDLDPPTSVTNEENALSASQSYGGIFSIGVPSSWMTLPCVKFT